jgi:diguanylate cyclase (GGDEF)-like protein
MNMVVTAMLDSDGSVLGYAVLGRDLSERRRSEEALRLLTMTDPLTGAGNRRRGQDALKAALAQAERRGQSSSLLLLDLDHFKRVNDGYGHAAGDLVLRECAVLLGPLVGSAGILGRLGGEEFLVLLPNTPLAAALALAERLRAAVASRAFMLPVGEGEGRSSILHRQTVSLGVAEWGPAMLETCDLLDAADRRLYQAKHEGRDRVSG